MYGVATLLFIQAFVNLGGVIGVLPITGVVFPFISGGGSSYIAFSAAIGLTLNIVAQQKKNQSFIQMIQWPERIIDDISNTTTPCNLYLYQ